MFCYFQNIFINEKNLELNCAKLEIKGGIFTFLSSASAAGGARHCAGAKQANQAASRLSYWRRILKDFRLEGFWREFRKKEERNDGSYKFGIFEKRKFSRKYSGKKLNFDFFAPTHNFSTG